MFRSVFRLRFVRKSILRSFSMTPIVVQRVTGYKKYSSRYIAFAGVLGLSLKAKSALEESKQILEMADKLFDESKFPELLNLLTQQESWNDDYEFLWRVARCKFHLSKKDSKNKDVLLRDSLSLVERALKINENCGPAHKWAAIILDAASALDGTRARIEQTMNVRKHMENAIKLMPKDGTSYYLLGEWHYSVFMTSWMEKKIASVIFATLPDADLEEALKMFQKAEEVEPGFYSKNLVLLAKTLIALKRDEELAKTSLIKVVEQYKTSDKWDDVEAVTEAKYLLKGMGINV